MGVTSTHIYCRPSCPAVTPKRSNVRFYPTTAAAQSAGFRACLRCRPDATPGSPEWDSRADLVGRAMRLIADGVVDREGVAGLASRLGYSARHLHRQLAAEVGAGPIALARAQRAQTARILIETTDLAFADVAFAAGFASIRQFNDTIREVFARTPTAMRAARRRPQDRVAGSISVRLAVRQPFDGDGLVAFLAHRAVPGVEEVVAGTYRRTLDLPHGLGTVGLTPYADHVDARFGLDDLRDLSAAVHRCRRLLDLDADPAAVTSVLGTSALLHPLVAACPGRRVPGRGRRLRVGRAGHPGPAGLGGGGTDPGRSAGRGGGHPPRGPRRRPDPRLPRRRGGGGRARRCPGHARSAPPPPCARWRPRRPQERWTWTRVPIGPRPRPALLAHGGIGPWTASYVAMRALGDPDAFLPADLGVRHALEGLGASGDPASAEAASQAWRPWRSYAVMHLWSTLGG